MQKIWIGLFLLAALGCSTTESENVRTQGLCADYDVVYESGSTVEVSAVITVGCGVGGTIVDLDGGDSLTVNGTTMSESSNSVSGASYSATVAYEEGGTYEIILTREDEGEYSSTVVMPSEFSVTGPTDNSTATQNNDITVSWSGSGSASDSILVQMTKSLNPSGTAYTSYTSTFGNGSTTIPASATIHEDSTGDMTAEIEIDRYTSGSISSSMEGGSFRATQRRNVTITLEQE